MQMLMTVQMRWLDAGHADPVDLRRQFTLDFRQTDFAAQKPFYKQRITTVKITCFIQQRRNFRYWQQRTRANQCQMNADTQLRAMSGNSHGIVERRAACHQTGATDDSLRMRRQNPPVHRRMQTEIIGIDDQSPHAGVLSPSS